MARLVREELGKCYYREGVGHLEKCAKLRGELLVSLGLTKGIDVFERIKVEIRDREWKRQVGLTCCAERYLEALKESQVRGYLFEQQNHLPGDETGG